MDVEALRNIKETLNDVKFPFQVISIAAYGSRVKKHFSDYSDLDLLVAASGIHPKRHRRGGNITQFKKMFPPMSLDILLLTRGEVESNFRNHNPLFLDITTEGIILFDSKDFLKNIIAETRDYININQILKVKNGWVFPVKAGVPTLLSKISNKDFSDAMIKDGERDFEIGKKLKDEKYFDKSVYHFQQSIEKFIKAIMIAMGVFKKTHFVGEELRALIKKGNVPDKWLEQLLDAAQISEEIEPEVSLSRYPGISEDFLWLPYEEYEYSDSLGAQQKAEKVYLISKGFILNGLRNKYNLKVSLITQKILGEINA